MDTIAILYVFATFGILDTAYLIWHLIQGTNVACPFFPDAWCHTVQHSSQSRTLGVPNSIAGFLMYAGIIASLALWQAGLFTGFIGYVLLALVSIGFLFSLYFMYVQIFVLRALCTWCVISFINFSVMAWAVWLR